MPTIKLLANRYDYREAVKEQRSLWLFSLLDALELDIEILEEAPDDVITDYLFENQVEILDYPDIGAIKVIEAKEVIGEWAGPDFILKIDKESGQMYYEISLEFWSIFDDEEGAD